MQSRIFFFICNFLIISNIFGQCIIKGKVKDQNEDITGATVYLKANKLVATSTDFSGNFSLTVKSLTPQIIVVSCIGYKTIEENIDCSKGGTITKEFVLEPAVTQINEVTITAKANKNNDAQLEKIKSRSTQTIDFISADAMKKTGDVNVAAAVTRVSGVATSSNGLLTVRGTGDRYLKTTINGSRIPTLDPFTNNIKLDIFPSSLIDNIIVSKTAQADIPGDWAGAYISVETKDYPDTLAINIESSLGYNTQTTFNNVISSQRSSTDWIGYDNGLRDIEHGAYADFYKTPSTYQEMAALGLGDYFKSLGVTGNTPWNDTYYKLGLIQLGLLGPAQINDPVAFQSAKDRYNSADYKGHAYDVINGPSVNFAKTLPNNWNSTMKRAPMSNSQSFSIGNQFKLFGKPFGFIVGFRYSGSIQYDPNSTANKLTAESIYKDGNVANYDTSFQKISKETNGWSGLASMTYKFHANHSVSLLFMPNLTGVNNVRSVKYYKGSEPNYGNYDQRVNQFYESRKQMIYQIKTDHFFSQPKVKVNFNSSYTDGNSNAPDMKIISFRSPSLSTQNNEPQFQATSIGTGRYFRYLSDKVFDSRISGEIPIFERPEITRKIKIGATYTNNKIQNEHYFYQLWEGLFSEYIVKANPDADPYGLDRFDIVNVVDPSTHDTIRSVQEYYKHEKLPTDRIFGYSNIYSGYITSEFAVNSAFTISGGVRLEQVKIYTDCNLFDSLKLSPDDERRTYEGGANIGTLTVKPGVLNELSILPSTNLIYKLKPNGNTPVNIRLGYSQTIARPSIRELSDNAFYDYELNSIVHGNSQLKMVTINNYDFRIESFFKSGDNISLSCFYKDFKNHIEIVNFGSYFIWLNNENYTWLTGIELEGKKLFLKVFELKANLTLVNSKSKFDKSYTDNTGYVVSGGGTVTHTMLGQAPYIINSMLTYTKKEYGVSVSLNYNVQGTRLVINGTGPLPDIYEMPRHLFDIKISKKLGKHFSANFKIQDIFNTSIVRSYKVDNKFVLDFDRYKYGTNYGFSVSYKL